MPTRQTAVVFEVVNPPGKQDLPGFGNATKPNDRVANEHVVIRESFPRVKP